MPRVAYYLLGNGTRVPAPACLRCGHETKAVFSNGRRVLAFHCGTCGGYEPVRCSRHLCFEPATPHSAQCVAHGGAMGPTL